mgnify:CR=1 FL=1
MNELRRAIVAIIDLASQMIDELDDETMIALSELLNAAAQRLEEENRITGGGSEVDRLTGGGGGNLTGGGGGGGNLTPAMPSSNVEGFAYDDKTGRLLVRFLGKHPIRNGPIYGYEGVPKNIFEIFRKGAIPAKTNGINKWGSWWQGKYPSIGAAMYHVIRGGAYPYQRLS